MDGIGQLTIAGSVATYYWQMDKKDLPYFPIVGAFWRTVRYHLGSICLGSFLLACVQLVRVVLWYVKQQIKILSKIKIINFLFVCADCCLSCLTSIIKYVNKQSYIHIAINGNNFCRSAFSAFSLLFRNPLRVAALTYVSFFVLFLSKLIVTAILFFGTWAVINIYTDKTYITLNYNIVPPIVVGVVGWIVASIFMAVLGIAIDTVFLSFLEDCERNDGTELKPYFMSENLKDITSVKNIERKGNGKVEPEED